MQTAGRLAAEENDDDGEGGAVIEALWIFEVPMALPLDARVPDAELQARARGARSARRRWGRSTRASRSPRRSCARAAPGEAIVREAKRRGVEAIVLAAEEPTRVGGGLRLGGKPGLHDTERGGDDALRRQQGAVPRDPHRAARRRRPLDPMRPGLGRGVSTASRRSAIPSACPMTSRVR